MAGAQTGHRRRNITNQTGVRQGRKQTGSDRKQYYKTKVRTKGNTVTENTSYTNIQKQLVQVPNTKSKGHEEQT